MNQLEFRPYGKHGLSAIVIGIVNIFLGFPKIGGEKMGSLIGGAFDLVFMGAMIFLGYWLYRQKVVVNEKSLQFIRTADGFKDLTINNEEVVSVEFNHLKQKVELKSGSRNYFISIPEKSEAFLKIKSHISSIGIKNEGKEEPIK